MQELNNSPWGHIHILSCGVAEAQPFSSHILSYAKKAQAIFASKALWQALADSMETQGKDFYPLTATARESAALALELCCAGQEVVVLASGDALYHGIGATLLHVYQNLYKASKAQGVEILPREALTFHPHITAFQRLFHILGMPWAQVALFSVHGGEPLPLRAMAQAPFALIYGGTQYTAVGIAQALISFHAPCAEQWGVLAERLGSEQQRIVVGTLAQLAEEHCHATSMLLRVPPKYYGLLQAFQKSPPNMCMSAAEDIHLAAPLLPPLLALGFPESFYTKEKNLITASDVRAVILARLRLPMWGVLWDVGAGSGSVGLEAAALCPHLQVLAVEKKAERVAHMQANAAKLGVTNYHPVQGDAVFLLQQIQQGQQGQQGACEKNSDAFALSTLPDALCKPNRIFIGGGGENLIRLVQMSLELVSPQGLVVVSVVTLESYHALYAYAQKTVGYTVQLSSMHMSHEQIIAGKYHHLQPQHPIYIFTFCQESAA